jgi:competence protein ComGC
LIAVNRALSRLANRALLRDQAGFTLVELLIASILGVVVSIIVAAIFFSALNGQRDVTASAAGNNSGQLASQSVTNGVRSAFSINVVNIASSTSQMLVVAVPSRNIATSSATYTCRAWYITANNGGAIYTFTSANAIGTPALSTVTSSWNVLATGLALSTRSGAQSAFFVQNAAATSVSYEFAMSDGTGKPILISSTASTRQTTNGSPSCFTA